MTTIEQPPIDDSATEHSDDDLVAKKKHSLALRWMHWINFPILMIMIWSGMRIYWADLREPYAFGIFGWQIIEFWPDGVNGFFQLERRLAKGLAFHLTFGWFFVINGAAYLIYLSRRGNWRYLIPDRQGLRDAPKVVLHDLHLRKEAPPQGKYNAMQQLTYTAVIVMATLLVLSGFAIYKPGQLSWLEAMFGGYDYARWVHFTMTVLLILFFFVHIVQVARSGWRNFASIITGYRLERRSDAAPSTTTDDERAVDETHETTGDDDDAVDEDADQEVGR